MRGQNSETIKHLQAGLWEVGEGRVRGAGGMENTNNKMSLTNGLDDFDRLGGFGELPGASAVLGSHAELILLAFLQAGDTESGVWYGHHVIG